MSYLYNLPIDKTEILWYYITNKGVIKLTLEELNARISAIDECYDILIKLYINSDCDTSEELFEILRDRYKELRDSAWNEFAQKIDELSKQA